MTDPGLHNFIKNALAEGKSKEEISASLIQGGGWTQADVDAAFTDVESGNISQVAEVVAEQPVENKKATIALWMAVLIVVLWGFIFLTSLTFPFIPLTTILLPLPVILVVFSIIFLIALIGVIIGLMGFKAHKVKASIAILICLISLLPAVGVVQFIFQLSRSNSKDVAAIDDSALKLASVEISDNQNSH
jgi:hypothetical protein